MRQNWM